MLVKLLRHVLFTGTLLAVCTGEALAQSNDNRSLDDNEILEAVEYELRLDEVIASDLLDVQVNDGIVTLSGSSFTLHAKRRAARLIKSLKGVRAVVNNAEVRSSGRSDEQIFGDVQAALKDDAVSDDKEIHVRVGQGLVTLTGKVDSYVEKILAEQVVAGVRGVIEVNNKIEVDVRRDRPDSEIRPEIMARFANSPWLADGLIKVHVDSGQVTLKGVVGSAAEKGMAGLLSWVAGVHNVDASQLEVQGGLDPARRRDKFTALRNDVQIQRAVKGALLYDPRVQGANIEVRVRKSAVALLGNVSSLQAKRAAEEDAKGTLGVRRVTNHLKVKVADWPGDQAVTDRANKALRRDAHLASMDVQVASRQGKVYLTGTANTFFGKHRAETVVANVPGVVELFNHIKVDQPWQPKPDEDIKEDTIRRLQWSALLDARHIRVSVADGVVTLHGRVDTRHEREAAVKHARQSGARQVVDELDLRDGRTTPVGMKATLIPNEKLYFIPVNQTGKSFRQFLADVTRARDYEQLPPEPTVDLVLKLQNEGTEPIDLRWGHDRGGIEMTLMGPGAVHVKVAQEFVSDFHSGHVITIEAGQHIELPIESLTYGFRNATDRWYWTEPGEYTLHVKLMWPTDASGLFGRQSVTADPITLTVKTKS